MKRSSSWTAFQTAVLIEQYPHCPDTRELAKSLGKSYEALHSRATVLKLKRLVPNSTTGRTSCTPEQEKFIIDNYLSMPVNSIARAIGRSEMLVKCRMGQLQLVVPQEIKDRFIQMGRRKKGEVPLNKGKKQYEFMSAEAIDRCSKTRFKKGEVPKNTKHDGAIAIRHGHKKRGGRPYKWIRLSMGKWEQLHVHIWKQKHGPVPAGHIIVFKDRDTMNVQLENLRCISRKQHAQESQNSDGWIATSMAHEKGVRGKIDIKLRNELLQRKDLIELKRKSLQLNKVIHEQRRAGGDD
jgi:hypothetical protein